MTSLWSCQATLDFGKESIKTIFRIFQLHLIRWEKIEGFIKVVGNIPHMIGILVVFYLPPRTSGNIHKQFRKKIYGEETSSWKGRYHYHRQGILDTIRHIYLYKGVVIVMPEDAEILLESLKRYNAIIHIRKVELTSNDRDALGVGEL